VTTWKNVSGSSISVPAVGRDVANQESVSVAASTIMPSGYFSAVAVPANVTVVAETGTLSWAPPASGPAVVDYLVTEWPGGFTAVTTETSVIVADLFSWLFTGTTAHTFTIRARSDMGISMPSAESAAVTPAIVPDPPTSVAATPIGATASEVAFLAPAVDGGRPVDAYVVTSDGPNKFTATGTASPVTVTGLMLGTPYTFIVQASNSAGISESSAASSSVLFVGTSSYYKGYHKGYVS
jgi:hypothetical protein